MATTPPLSRLSGDDAIQGAVLWQLLDDLYDSVHRRVETIRILDDETARRRVTIDLELASHWTALSLSRLPAVPITYLKKEPLRRFDLRDRAGAALPVLTKRENGTLVGHALIYTIESHLADVAPALDPLPEMLEDVIRTIVEGGVGEAHESLQRVRDGARVASSDPLNAYWSAISKSESVMAALSTLAGNFVLMTSDVPDRREIFKLEYDEPLKHKNHTRLLASCGWAPEVLTFEAPGTSLARSYHLELGAPRHLRIVGAPLRVLDAETKEPVEPEPIRPIPPVYREAHYYLDKSRPATVGRADLSLKAETGGIVLVARVLASLVAVLLLASLTRLDEVTNSNRSQVTAAVLLVAPALISVIVVRPDENELAARMLKGLRVMLTVNTMTAVLAAALLAGGFSSDELRPYWVVLAGLATVMALLLVLPMTPGQAQIFNFFRPKSVSSSSPNVV